YRIDNYELLELIGIGGMGIVWKAQRVVQDVEGEKGNRGEVALKMILAGPDASAAEVQRFVREIELHSRLNHAHIVPIYHVGNHGGLHYFTMQLVEAGSLKSRLDTLRLLARCSRTGRRKSWSRGMIRKSAERIARLMARVAEAVHHAHQHRLLHRDLKPGNILLHGKDHPFVADFGLVMRIEEAGGTSPKEGTPPYM